ncbi:hypothetical protein [Saccharospirillum impatiens]|uniref:hypothetical protein n=1 Tax=Saccharospirillum impatiens TaxID=169438 RepID=UPI00040140DF|nr:hypothetical protein [Saccharospirillum impatiens]
MITKLMNRINQRRELNRWLQEKRAERYVAEHLNSHLQKDIGLGQQAPEAPLTWREPQEKSRQEKQQQRPEQQARSPGGKSVGPPSA